MLAGSLRVGLVTTFVRAVTTLSVVIFLFTPATTVATIRIYQLVNDLNWGGATAFTVADIMLAITALAAFAFLTRGAICRSSARGLRRMGMQTSTSRALVRPTTLPPPLERRLLR